MVIFVPVPPPAPSTQFPAGIDPTIYLPIDLTYTIDHGDKLDEFYANIPYRTGHSRTRRLYAGDLPRTIHVVWELSAEQMAIIDDWAENTLQAYSLPFWSQVASTAAPGLVWWKGFWTQPYSAEPLDGGRWVVTGDLYMVGQPQVNRPTANMKVEFNGSISGSILISSSATFSVEYTVSVEASIRLRIEFFAYVDTLGDDHILREDGSFMLHESPGKFRRENS